MSPSAALHRISPARSHLAGPAVLLTALLVAACGGDDASDADAPAPDAPAAASGDAPPGTDVWLGILTPHGDSARVTALRNVTNRPGYDNQPAFTPEGDAVLYTVVDDAGQADIWRYDLNEGTASAVTTTSPESEYSPTPVPGSNAFTSIRVEADSTQRLWRFPMGGGAATVLFPDLAPVGYHAWANEEWVVMFILGNPPTLVVAGGETADVRELARDVGRSIQSLPGEDAVSFVQRVASPDAATGGAPAANPGDTASQQAGGTRIMRWSPADGVTPVTDALDGGDFHAWTPDGLLLMGSGSTIRAWREGWDEWRTVGEIPGGGTVSRMAVSPDGGRIAVVVEAPGGS